MPGSRIAAALNTRDKLLDSAIEVFIEKGFTRSSVDEICRRAGTTKGAFFHHFENKQTVGLLALDRFAERLTASFQDGARERPADPIRRLLDYLDRAIVVGESTEPFPTCLIGLLTLELAASNPTFRSAAQNAFERWLGDVEEMMADAIAVAHKKDHRPRELAELFLATLQGSLILCRAREDRTVIAKNLTAFKRYLQTSLS